LSCLNLGHDPKVKVTMNSQCVKENFQESNNGASYNFSRTQNEFFFLF
jgi:hypothetical protein